MSFKFPSFNLQQFQESLPTVDLENITKSIQNVNVQQYSEQFSKAVQPFASKTGELISTQLHQVQQLATTQSSNIEVSELPADYLELEKNCDLLLKLYTDLIQFTNDTYGKVSYDYPPGNTSLNKLREANVGGIIGTKFTQLRNATSPEEFEKALLASATPAADGAHTLPKTLFHQLSLLGETHSKALEQSSSISKVLAVVSATYKEIGDSRLKQDDAILKQVSAELVNTLNAEFVKVNELRKKVYSSRQQFDYIRSQIDEEAEEENEELITKEDELVNATEIAVTEMKKLLRPSKNVNLIKLFVAAQRDFFEESAKKLAQLSADLDKIDIVDEDDE